MKLFRDLRQKNVQIFFHSKVHRNNQILVAIKIEKTKKQKQKQKQKNNNKNKTKHNKT